MLLFFHESLAIHLVDSFSAFNPNFIYAVVTAVAFIEAALVFGFMFPGNILLICSGLIAGTYSDTEASIFITYIVLANLLGSVMSYWIGSKYGRIFIKNNNAPSIERVLLRSEKFYGSNKFLTVVLSKFAPGLRSFVPLIAGIARMPIALFAIASFLGAALWSIIFVEFGVWLTSFGWIHDAPVQIIGVLIMSGFGLSIVNFMRGLGK